MLFYDGYTRECANDYGFAMVVLLVVVEVAVLLQQRSRARVLAAYEDEKKKNVHIAFWLHIAVICYMAMQNRPCCTIQTVLALSDRKMRHVDVLAPRPRVLHASNARVRKCRDKYDLMILHCVFVCVCCMCAYACDSRCC